MKSNYGRSRNVVKKSVSLVDPTTSFIYVFSIKILGGKILTQVTIQCLSVLRLLVLPKYRNKALKYNFMSA
jgi:hypothetical protein